MLQEARTGSLLTFFAAQFSQRRPPECSDNSYLGLRKSSKTTGKICCLPQTVATSSCDPQNMWRNTLDTNSSDLEHCRLYKSDLVELFSDKHYVDASSLYRYVVVDF